MLANLGELRLALVQACVDLRHELAPADFVGNEPRKVGVVASVAFRHYCHESGVDLPSVLQDELAAGRQVLRMQLNTAAAPVAAASPKVGTQATVKANAHELAKAMTRLHGGQWTAHVDHDTGLF